MKNKRSGKLHVREKHKRARSFQNERFFFEELIEGLVHQFPICCVLQYCSDIYKQQGKQALRRGVVFFRTFSLHPAETVWDKMYRMDMPDHFVPCSKCLEKFLAIKKIDRSTLLATRRSLDQLVLVTN